MKFIILIMILTTFVSSAVAFRGGGGFRGGMSVGVGVGGVGPRGNVGVGVGVHGTHGSVYAHRAAAMSVHYHPYTHSYWGWYGYAPYHYYYPTSTSTTYTEVKAEDSRPAEIGSVVNEIPSDCKSETFKGVAYKHCGDKWYEPQYAGTEIEYQLVTPPQ